jgi:hypothetical protein
MAEPTPAPALPSTADAIPYVPVSWMAVAAITVASLFVAVLLALGVSAFLAKKPLLQPEILVLPALGIVLSFAARRVIRNAEGTRTGENLANSAWWICLIAGLGYAAYLLAIDFAIRRDARTTLDRWIEKVKAGDDVSINDAFLRTRDPAQRSKISPDDTAQIYGRFREEYIGFKQTDLIRLAQRNKGQCDITPEGVKEWTYRGEGIDCAFNGTMKCPEGKFPLIIGLRGAESTGGETLGRQWGVVYSPNTSYIQRDQISLTPYGWLMAALEESGSAFANQFLLSVRAGPTSIPYAYQAMMKSDSKAPPRTWQIAAVTLPVRIAVTGGLAATAPYTSDFVAYSFPDHFYKAVGGGEPTAEQRAQFKAIWETTGLMQAGGRLKNSLDKQPLLTVTDSSIELRVPCELPFPGQETSAAARGRLVVVSTDPELIRELSQLRSEANPDSGTSVPPASITRRDFKWRLVRLESDMMKVQMQDRPGAPGGAEVGDRMPMPGH